MLLAKFSKIINLILTLVATKKTTVMDTPLQIEQAGLLQKIMTMRSTVMSIKRSWEILTSISQWLNTPTIQKTRKPTR